MFSLHVVSQLKPFSHSSRNPVFRLLYLTVYFFATENKNRVSTRMGNTSKTNVDKQQHTFFLSMGNFTNFSEIYLKLNLYWTGSNLFLDL